MLIQKLKRELSKTFDIKDFGSAKHILEMKILLDRKAGKLWLSHERYIERMLEGFNTKNSKLVSTSFVSHFKLSKRLYPSTEKKKKAKC